PFYRAQKISNGSKLHSIKAAKPVIMLVQLASVKTGDNSSRPFLLYMELQKLMRNNRESK
ncbi:hypothetical protein, partial [uncultured Gimesia sp.]|uniref:hypothetical protein n=1 Tax=uncultured Gimesia sp. TaxID=1678688 RepID=UPI00260F8B14